MLVVKINLDQNSENLKKVVDLLEGLDIVATSWEDDSAPKVTGPVVHTGNTDDDPKVLSSAIDRAIQQARQ